VLGSYLTALARSDSESYAEVSDAHYEAAWRATQWRVPGSEPATVSLDSSSAASDQAPDLLLPTRSAQGQLGLHACLYQSLRALTGLTRSESDAGSLESIVSVARQSVVQRLTSITSESVHEVFPVIGESLYCCLGSRSVTHTLSDSQLIFKCSRTSRSHGLSSFGMFSAL
jgi:hypothetical protein